MRLFVAIDIPNEIHTALADACARLKPAAPDARWVRPESLHLTLKFIGEQQEEQLEAIRAALSEVKGPTPFRMAPSGLHFFPNSRRPAVLAALVPEAGHAQLADLAAQVDAQLGRLKIPREERRFRAHLTVARLAPRARHTALEAALAGMMQRDWGEFEVREFHLYRSELKRGGAEYTRLATFPLRGARA